MRTRLVTVSAFASLDTLKGAYYAELPRIVGLYDQLSEGRPRHGGGEPGRAVKYADRSGDPCFYQSYEISLLAVYACALHGSAWEDLVRWWDSSR